MLTRLTRSLTPLTPFHPLHPFTLHPLTLNPSPHTSQHQTHQKVAPPPCTSPDRRPRGQYASRPLQATPYSLPHLPTQSLSLSLTHSHSLSHTHAHTHARTHTHTYFEHKPSTRVSCIASFPALSTSLCSLHLHYFPLVA